MYGEIMNDLGPMVLYPPTSMMSRAQHMHY